MERKSVLLGLFVSSLFLSILCGGLLYLNRESVRNILPVRGTAPSFTLTDSNGQTFDSAVLEGKVWVADFFFSSCAGPCPMMAAQMGRIEQHFTDGDQVRLVNITVDPLQDTPEKLTKYARKLKADTSRRHFLTGDRDMIHDLSVKGFMIGDPDQLINHSTRFVLVDQNGFIRGFYEGTEPAQVDELIKAMEQLLKNGPQKKVRSENGAA